MMLCTSILWSVFGFAGQSWPSRPIVLIVPFPPGPVDTSVRLVTERVGKILGQPIVVENKAGAGMRLGTNLLLRAPKDGYTIGVLAQANGAITPALDPNAGYDPLKNMTLIALSHESSLVMIASPSLGVKSLAEVIEKAKQTPEAINYGSAGLGSAGHLWFEYFKKKSGTNFAHIPYKGEMLAMQDLLGGQVSLMLSTVQLAKPYMQAGRVVPLAIADKVRSPQLPGLETMEEAGIEGFYVTTWLGFAAPEGIPKDVARRLTAAFMQALQAPDVKAKLEQLDFKVRAAEPAEFRALIEEDMRKIRIVAGQSGIQLRQ